MPFVIQRKQWRNPSRKNLGHIVVAHNRHFVLFRLNYQIPKIFLWKIEPVDETFRERSGTARVARTKSGRRLARMALRPCLLPSFSPPLSLSRLLEMCPAPYAGPRRDASDGLMLLLHLLPADTRQRNRDGRREGSKHQDTWCKRQVWARKKDSNPDPDPASTAILLILFATTTNVVKKLCLYTFKKLWNSSNGGRSIRRRVPPAGRVILLFCKTTNGEVSNQIETISRR